MTMLDFGGGEMVSAELVDVIDGVHVSLVYGLASGLTRLVFHGYVGEERGVVSILVDDPNDHEWAIPLGVAQARRIIEDRDPCDLDCTDVDHPLLLPFLPSDRCEWSPLAGACRLGHWPDRFREWFDNPKCNPSTEVKC